MNGLPDPSLKLGHRRIGSEYPCFIVAEIGTDHRGDLKRARELVEAAAEAGADCVKVQAVFAEEILHRESGSIDLPGGKVQLFERFKKIERGIDFYLAIKEETEKKGIMFLCTPFGLRSASMLREMGVAAVKIASPELNHYPLLSASSFGVPLILSTGVSTLGDIELALHAVTAPAALLHCITAYPAPPEEYNLQCIRSLTNIFGVPVGVSDHSEDPLLVPLTSVACAGCIIEKHMTLKKHEGGLDDSFALEPKAFSSMTKEVRLLEQKQQDQRKVELIARFGKNLVLKIMGDGVKRLSPSERGNYRTSNRSLIALEDLSTGTRISKDNTALLRSEKNTKPGLKPDEYPLVLGHQLVKEVKGGVGITWDDLLL